MDFWQVLYFFLKVKVDFDVFLKACLMLLYWLQLSKQRWKKDKVSTCYAVTHYGRSSFCLYVSTDWRWLQNCHSVLSSASLSPKHWKINILECLENFCTFLHYHYKILKFTTKFSVFRIWNPKTFWHTWRFLQR